MACGAAGMSEADFWGGEMRDAMLRVSGYQEMQQGIYRSRWEQARLICDVVVACMTKSKSAGIKFAWEEKKPGARAELTPEQVAAAERRQKKLDKLMKEWPLKT